VEDDGGDVEVAASRAFGGCNSEGLEDEARDVGDGGGLDGELGIAQGGEKDFFLPYGVGSNRGRGLGKKNEPNADRGGCLGKNNSFLMEKLSKLQFYGSFNLSTPNK
jgi:hypothetical protein